MNFIKNIMLTIISIGFFVGVELSVVKYLKKEREFNHLTSPQMLLSLNSLKGSKTPLTNNVITPMALTAKPSTEEEKIFMVNLLSSAREKISLLKGYLTHEEFLTAYRLKREIDKKLEYQAKKYLGIRYVWGATGPNKFDCSGFTQKVYKSAGVQLPRHSTRQAMVGKYIKYKDLQRGDMVFFDTSRKHKGVVNHVGIYLEDGKFIHASSGKKRVVITDFNKKKFYKRRFLWGRRIFDVKVEREDLVASLSVKL